MPPNPKRKRYSWFDDYRRWDYEDLSDEDYSEEFEENSYKQPRNRREMEIQRAIKMAHRVRDVYHPLIDVIEYSKIIIVAAELHGVKGCEIMLKIVGQALTIGYKWGKIHNIRVIKLPKPVDPKPIQSHYKNGTLLLEFKKREYPTSEFKIPISNPQ